MSQPAATRMRGRRPRGTAEATRVRPHGPVIGASEGIDVGMIAELGAKLAFDDDQRVWMLEARCLDADPEAFFPEKGGSTREAKRICGICPVQQECLEYALERDQRFGIWGGMSERERRRFKRRRSA
jgi:WhiB family transcriptional regulator, redox-sensing transcriptional regulator